MLTRLRKEKSGREIFLKNFDIFDFEGFMIFNTKKNEFKRKERQDRFPVILY